MSFIDVDVSSQIRAYNELWSPLTLRYSLLNLLPLTPQILSLHTIVRDDSTSDADFVFHSDRLNRLLIEFALTTLPYREKTVISPTGHSYSGSELIDLICGVALVCSGESMETALRSVARDVAVGKMLVRHEESQSEVVYSKLPCDIATHRVFLLVAVWTWPDLILTAMTELLSKGVSVDRITLVSLACGRAALEAILDVYPNLAAVIGFVDVDAPVSRSSLGSFGGRYFGTTRSDSSDSNSSSSSVESFFVPWQKSSAE